MTLTPSETADFQALAALIIPASAKHNVPGADDALIFADILNSLARDVPDVQAALAALHQIAGAPLASLPPARQTEIANQLREHGGTPVAVLTRIVLLCYYRDDRVMLSLGLEPRPPFPKGHVLEQGDWSLLDQVKSRAPIWRPV